MPGWLGSSGRGRLYLVALAAVIVAGIVVLVLVLTAQTPSEQLAGLANEDEACAQISTRSDTAQAVSRLTPAPLGFAERAQQRVSIYCTVAGSILTYFGFRSPEALNQAVSAYPIVARRHGCVYERQNLVVEQGPWDGLDRQYLLQVCRQLHGKKLGSAAVWRPVPSS